MYVGQRVRRLCIWRLVCYSHFCSIFLCKSTQMIVVWMTVLWMTGRVILPSIIYFTVIKATVVQVDLMKIFFIWNVVFFLCQCYGECIKHWHKKNITFQIKKMQNSNKGIRQSLMVCFNFQGPRFEPHFVWVFCTLYAYTIWVSFCVQY